MLKQRKEKPASFLQIKEQDDYDDDDGVAKLSHDGPSSDNTNEQVPDERVESAGIGIGIGSEVERLGRTRWSSKTEN